MELSGTFKYYKLNGQFDADMVREKDGLDDCILEWSI